MPTQSATVLTSDWSEILDNLQQALARAEAEAVRSLEAPVLAPAGAEPIEPAAYTDQLAGYRRQLASGVARADLLAAEAEAVLKESEEALRRWLDHVQSIRGKLAKAVAGPVR
jgi:hypothetical protein